MSFHILSNLIMLHFHFKYENVNFLRAAISHFFFFVTLASWTEHMPKGFCSVDEWTNNWMNKEYQPQSSKRIFIIYLITSLLNNNLLCTCYVLDSVNIKSYKTKSLTSNICVSFYSSARNIASGSEIDWSVMSARMVTYTDCYR